MPLPEPQTFFRRRQARGQHPRPDLTRLGASARSLQADDGLLDPAVLGRLQAVAARAQYNRMVGIYVQEAFDTRRVSSDSAQWLFEDFELLLTMQDASSDHAGRVVQQQVIRRITSEGLEPPEYDLLELPNQNEY